jgi:hypothetical protein
VSLHCSLSSTVTSYLFCWFNGGSLLVKKFCYLVSDLMKSTEKCKINHPLNGILSQYPFHAIEKLVFCLKFLKTTILFWFSRLFFVIFLFYYIIVVAMGLRNLFSVYLKNYNVLVSLFLFFSTVT